MLIFECSRYQYFKAKNMTTDQVSIFIEERKWDYRGAFAAHFICAADLLLILL